MGGVGAQAQAEKTLRIATEGAFKPWNFTEAGGKLAGYEIDLSAVLCERMKVKCEIVAQDFGGMIPALNIGKFDAIMAGMSITPKRQEAIAFSVPYGQSMTTFVTVKSSPLVNLPNRGQRVSLATESAQSLETIDALKPGLKGKVIGVQGSTIAAAFLEKYFKDSVEVREYKTTEQHDLDLMAGRVDAVLVSLAYINSVLEKPEYKTVTTTGPRFTGGVFGIGVGVGLRKQDVDLKAKFDEAIKSAAADGTIANLSVRWFGFDVTPK